MEEEGPIYYYMVSVTLEEEEEEDGGCGDGGGGAEEGDGEGGAGGGNEEGGEKTGDDEVKEEEQPASSPDSATADKNNNTSNTSSRGTKIAKFLLKTTARLAMDVATGGVASSVLDIAMEAMEFAEPALTASLDLANGNEDDVRDMMLKMNRNNNGNDNTKSQGKTIAKILMKKGGWIAINLATGGLASPVLDFWEAVS